MTSTQPPDTRLLEERHGVPFIECLNACLHSEILPQWERLYGKRLIARDPLTRMIDEATGYDMTLMKEFVDFCYLCVFRTL